jgi:hypothetical protein
MVSVVVYVKVRVFFDVTPCILVDMADAWEKPAVLFRIDQIFDLEEASVSRPFCHEHASSRLIRKVRAYLTNYTASHCRRP